MTFRRGHCPGRGIAQNHVWHPGARGQLPVPPLPQKLAWDTRSGPDLAPCSARPTLIRHLRAAMLALRSAAPSFSCGKAA